MPTVTTRQKTDLQRRILTFYRKHGRKLPFRETTNPYRILVSEVMLQQTQVHRVVPRYIEWIKQWPDFRRLAKASKREVLKAWSGLGYNRRALNLRDTARIVVEKCRGRLPLAISDLVSLPGVGPYTARAVLIFVANRQLAAVDTNIRRVLIHELRLDPNIGESELADIAEELVPRGRSREWHNALMDYGALRLRREAAHIKPRTRQSRFDGSRRQVRGLIVRELTLKQFIRIDRLSRYSNFSEQRIREAAGSLERDGMVRVTKQTIRAV